MTTEVDNYLEHYGVKGMKWGKHQSSSDKSSSGSGQKTRKELRSLDRANRKAAKQKRKDDWDNEVNTARDQLDGKAQKLNEAQKQYKTNKATMGKVAAKQILREHEDDFIKTWNVASLQTTKEAHVNMIAGVGLLALSAVVPIAASAARNSW
jgi:predicted nucleic acid-binding OB-fold protein